MKGMLAGKVAIVTGGGRGIGRGVALLMASEGARVVVCDIGASLEGEGTDASPAQQVVEEIKRVGGDALASTLSITDPKNAEEIVKVALTAFGRIDILVNNAGILRDRIFHRMSWSDWSDVLAVHLNGSFNMSRACAVHFREQNGGAFVHMTSTSALVGNFGQANYMAAKFGIVGRSRVPATCSPGIRYKLTSAPPPKLPPSKIVPEPNGGCSLTRVAELAAKWNPSSRRVLRLHGPG